MSTYGLYGHTKKLIVNCHVRSLVKDNCMPDQQKEQDVVEGGQLDLTSIYPLKSTRFQTAIGWRGLP